MPEQTSGSSQANPELLSKIFEIGYALPFPTSYHDHLSSLHPELSGHFNMNMKSLEEIGADLSNDSGQMCAYLAGTFMRLVVKGTTTLVLLAGVGQGMNYFMEKEHKKPESPTVTAPATSASAPHLTRK